MAYFPMFIDLTNRACLVVGGGQVALRKVKVLLDFDAVVTVISKDFCPELKNLAETQHRISLIPGEINWQDIEKMELVIAATDDGEVNRQISEFCRIRKIPVNVVDEKEECSFILPSYVKEGNLVAAFSSGGNSPVLTQYLKKQEKEILTPMLGEVNEQLGKWRKKVQETFREEEKRKQAFQSVLMFAIEQEKVPTDEEIKEILKLLESEI